MATMKILTWLTPTRAAQRLGVSPQSVILWVKQGRLGAVLTPHGRLIDPESVERLATERQQKAGSACDQ